jgi:hypothetical protein
MWVGLRGRGLGDDLQTRNDQITLCGRKILWVEKMGGNFKHHNITLSIFLVAVILVLTNTHDHSIREWQV